MNPFNIYFSASPLGSAIGLTILLVLGWFFIYRSPTAINQVIGKQKRVYVVLFVLVFFIGSCFNIGTRQAELNRSQFDTQMNTEIIKKSPTSTEAFDARGNFNQALDKAKKENEQ
ncbi:hypothetical protein [Stenotrophomonas phage BUCTxx100]|nr:hypothetical protein [Stenotrophomonas phage BUCTxx100]